ncbi:NAD(P)-dependent dehydrogenase (short-subunit alcohol dehydrogenase family) [Paenibacillus sp. PvR052]|nr:NAD(P)-dependent dehydrogenase (short-subunit alcohol dehydrogenase family) [Paenibacillus sp. PvP091]MBP1168463.1 NAD(P)-dependent dehydrogenase (short-subunit alcohol dehydrogenase family) [Paenibacillus sp. PvR098]MBP2439491.1 NAD(P)-dependent dehydrogenase (short-subunit alcohol dehydrogenase family) [Paenibacillus sp. PvP052]
MSMNLFDLTGKTAVIIGGNSTLGGAMAIALGGHGADVAIVGRNMEKSKEVAKRVEEAGGRAQCFSADATSADDLQRVLSEVTAWTGRCDVLMNCPGMNSPTPFFELKMDEWDSIMDVNLKSVVLACQIFGKYMVDKGEGGSIINISSVSSEPPLSRVFTYSASKAAVNNVTQFLAREFAPARVRVNAIIPGFFPAEQNRKILSPDRVESIMKHTPMNRFGDAEELQGAAVYLASEKASSFVTGTLLRVDGGFGAMTI